MCVFTYSSVGVSVGLILWAVLFLFCPVWTGQIPHSSSLLVNVKSGTSTHHQLPERRTDQVAGNQLIGCSGHLKQVRTMNTVRKLESLPEKSIIFFTFL